MKSHFSTLNKHTCSPHQTHFSDAKIPDTFSLCLQPVTTFLFLFLRLINEKKFQFNLLSNYGNVAADLQAHQILEKTQTNMSENHSVMAFLIHTNHRGGIIREESEEERGEMGGA